MQNDSCRLHKPTIGRFTARVAGIEDSAGGQYDDGNVVQVETHVVSRKIVEQELRFDPPEAFPLPCRVEAESELLKHARVPLEMVDGYRLRQAFRVGILGSVIAGLQPYVATRERDFFYGAAGDAAGDVAGPRKHVPDRTGRVEIGQTAIGGDSVDQDARDGLDALREAEMHYLAKGERISLELIAVAPDNPVVLRHELIGDALVMAAHACRVVRFQKFEGLRDAKFAQCVFEACTPC